MVKSDWVYHVTTKKKIQKYQKIGRILPPVRAWKNIESALDFSFRTGRTIILRIKLREATQLEGHKGNALVSRHYVEI